jgi:hypothetical protein
MAAMENAAMIVVLRRQRLDGEYQGRAGGGSGAGFGAATFSGPLVGRVAGADFIGAGTVVSVFAFMFHH